MSKGSARKNGKARKGGASRGGARKGGGARGVQGARPVGRGAARSARPLFTLRPTKKSDLPYLALMSEGQEIGIPPNFDEHGTTAVNADDVPVGYIHVEPTEKGAHVGPVVVFENWRGFDVGTALVRHAHDEFGVLKLVSNGSSNGFYDKLGFEVVGWGDIDERFHRDCLSCPHFEECGPTPYALY